MMEQQYRSNSLSDSINLYECWGILLRKKNLIASIFFAALIGSAVVSFLMEKLYKVEVSMRLNQAILVISLKERLVSPRELVDILGKFDRDKIEAIFGKGAQVVKGVKAYALPAPTDKMKISLELTDPSRSQEVIKRFVEYVNQMPVMQKTFAESREQLIKRLDEIDRVIEKSREDAVRFEKMIIREKLNPIGFNPVQFNRMVSDLEVEKLALKQSLENLTGCEVTSQPMISTKPIRPRPLLYMTLAGIISLLFGIFLALFLSYWESLKKQGR
jgi:uncharacterized protein involved in exopolysaccharide biosynthesis